jgi:hypothetical protein
MIEKNQALFQSIDKPFCLAYISDLKDEVLRKSLINYFYRKSNKLTFNLKLYNIK